LFATTWITHGRCSTMIDHLTRDGNTEISMRRTQEFISICIKDVLANCDSEFLNLSKKIRKQYQGSMTKLISKWWTNYVRNNS